MGATEVFAGCHKDSFRRWEQHSNLGLAGRRPEHVSPVVKQELTTMVLSMVATSTPFSGCIASCWVSDSATTLSKQHHATPTTRTSPCSKPRQLNDSWLARHCDCSCSLSTGSGLAACSTGTRHLSISFLELIIRGGNVEHTVSGKMTPRSRSWGRAAKKQRPLVHSCCPMTSEYEPFCQIIFQELQLRTQTLLLTHLKGNNGIAEPHLLLLDGAPQHMLQATMASTLRAIVVSWKGTQQASANLHTGATCKLLKVSSEHTSNCSHSAQNQLRFKFWAWLMVNQS
eukprot:5116028-Amphidinium_carterae.3